MSAPLRRVRRAAALLALLAAAPGTAGGQAVPRDSILALVKPVHFGVPTSPAFALLPEQPGEVPHVVTPSDFQAVLKSWFDGNRLKVGAAFDTRPFVSSAGDLRSYARSPLRAALFRTVISAGTSLARKGSDDVLVAVGVRVPLVDRGDPRADPVHQERLAAAYTGALTEMGQPPFDATAEDFAKRRQRASAALDTIRRRYAAEHWNALKLDVGLAGSVRTAGDEPRADSVEGRRGGIWSALSLPLERFGQLTFSGKAVWSRADSAADPTGSYTAGARARLFASDRFAFSAEAASVWGRYDDAGLDDRWTHLGVAAEWYVPELKGWIAAGYGGDTGRSDQADARFALRYAFYRDRVLER